jgi:hypothetical protein
MPSGVLRAAIGQAHFLSPYAQVNRADPLLRARAALECAPDKKTCPLLIGKASATRRPLGSNPSPVEQYDPVAKQIKRCFDLISPRNVAGGSMARSLIEAGKGCFETGPEGRGDACAVHGPPVSLGFCCKLIDFLTRMLEIKSGSAAGVVKRGA